MVTAQGVQGTLSSLTATALAWRQLVGAWRAVNREPLASTSWTRTPQCWAFLDQGGTFCSKSSLGRRLQKTRQPLLKSCVFRGEGPPNLGGGSSGTF